MTLLSKKDVRDRVLYSPAHITRLEAAGQRPKRIRRGVGRVGWLPARLPVPAGAEQSTQGAFGRILLDLAGGAKWPELGRLLTGRFLATDAESGHRYGNHRASR